MSSSARYSARLGEITDAQFEAAVRKAGLGRFIAASTPSAGLFGQNVFLTTTTGEFVLRGAPHWHDGVADDTWQFPKERLYADLLHARTRVPVAWPQRLDATLEHFAWPYLITPRLPGICLAEPEALERLDEADRAGAARAMGEALAELHSLSWPFSGDFDPARQALAPYAGGYAAHLAGELAKLSASARAYGAFTPEDDAWLDRLAEADAATPEPVSTYVHNDYNLGNVLVEKVGGTWRVSGVIDLMTSCFGDPAADLPRLTCHWLDVCPLAAHAFLRGYREAGGAARPTPARLDRLTAHERLHIWAYFSRPGNALEALRGQTYRLWAGRYAERVAEVWDAAGRA